VRRHDIFDANHLVNGIVVTAVVGLALVPVPTVLAVAVLVALAFACGRLGGRDAGLGSVAVGTFMFGYAITKPHFVWEIQNDHDVVLLLVLFVGSLVAAEAGARRLLRLHR
jgi:K+-sensing histidine kinase KdpD